MGMSHRKYFRQFCPVLWQMAAFEKFSPKFTETF